MSIERLQSFSGISLGEDSGGRNKEKETSILNLFSRRRQRMGRRGRRRYSLKLRSPFESY